MVTQLLRGDVDFVVKAKKTIITSLLQASPLLDFLGKLKALLAQKCLEHRGGKRSAAFQEKTTPAFTAALNQFGPQTSHHTDCVFHLFCTAPSTQCAENTVTMVRTITIRL